MRISTLALCLLAAAGIAAFSIAPAQDNAKAKQVDTSDPDKALNMRGDRFPPLKYKDMTPAQKAAAEKAMRGKGAAGGFAVELHSPELMEATRSDARAHSSLSAKQQELIIMTNARFWTSQFEWWVHHPAAVKAGVKEETVQAIREGRRPTTMGPDEEVCYNFVSEILKTKQVSDATFNAAKAALGEKGVVDMISLTGSYINGSLMMNADRYPMRSPNDKPELTLIPKPLP